MRLEISPSKLMWMHGESDHRVSLDAGLEIPEIFEESGWDVTRFSIQRAHRFRLNFMPSQRMARKFC